MRWNECHCDIHNDPKSTTRTRDRGSPMLALTSVCLVDQSRAIYLLRAFAPSLLWHESLARHWRTCVSYSDFSMQPTFCRCAAYESSALISSFNNSRASRDIEMPPLAWVTTRQCWRSFHESDTRQALTLCELELKASISRLFHAEIVQEMPAFMHSFCTALGTRRQ